MGPVPTLEIVALDFVGLERLTGRLGEREGSFVLRHEGTYSDEEMTQMSVVVAGSGTGALAGLRGESTLTTGRLEEYPFRLRYVFDSQAEKLIVP